MTKKNYAYKKFKANLTLKASSQVYAAFVQHVYKQVNVALLASLLCALIVLLGLFSPQVVSSSRLIIWVGIFLVITIFRYLLHIFYENDKARMKHVKMWHGIYIVGAALGGLIWGSAAILFMSSATILQQTLIVMTLAGVTAGSVPLSAAIPFSAILYVIFAITPFIYAFVEYNSYIYHLFAVALTIYLCYLIVLSIKTYHLIRNAVVLQFENEELLNYFEMMNIKLEYDAFHDPLTQLANRRYFLASLRVSLVHAKRISQKVALLYFDLDNFKTINDHHGHDAGDVILTTVTKRLKEYFRSDKIIARVGGDEFAIYIENIEDIHQIETIAQHICHAIARPIKMKTHLFKVSASIGIGIFPDDAKDIDDLIKVADHCMYISKSHGGNQYHFNRDLLEYITH